MTEPSCPFCRIPSERIFHADALIIGLWDAFPVSPGHALLVPKRHVATWFEATEEEQLALIRGIEIARQRILETHQPDGFNLGMNVGEAAGQTVFHLHFHVLPRYRGDVPDPRGGVRHVIPAKANYLAPPATGQPPPGRPPPELGAAPHDRALIQGGDDPLLPHLLAHLDRARAVDVAVAFVVQSGVDAIYERCREVLVRGGQIRFLTGDYLQVTQPDALLRLLDLRQVAEGRGEIELRIFQADGTTFHPKVYIFRSLGVASESEGSSGEGIAFIGSSNLTRTALTHGVEWNYRVVSPREGRAFRELLEAFEELFLHPNTVTLTEAWIEDYRERYREAQPLSPGAPATEPVAGFIGERPEVGYAETEEEQGRIAALGEEEPSPPPTPWEVQTEALAALRVTRETGNQAGLVVLATGLGKTWLSAFDSMGGKFDRVLFVAHREEILGQALETFRRIAPSAHLGLFTGTEKSPTAQVVFASIQTLGRSQNLERFDPQEFDYIVIDEFHHACAKTYRKVIDYFDPQFLLGLTATPERRDGGDLLALCQENLVYRCDLVEGITRGNLVPFKYFGVPDEIDYAQIPWRGQRFDEEELTRAAATLSRAQNALEQYQERAGERALGFCVSIRHAEFMADYFRQAGVRAAAVHSGPDSAPRAASLEKLTDGRLDIIFAVDIFNEGVDLPLVDTVLMLRPTESRVIWLQQFGRGLRVAEGKDHLRVIDYIGNHRSFLLKPQTLLDLGASDYQTAVALRKLQEGAFELPPGCEVTYELEAIEILRGLLRESRGEQALREFCETFRELHGVRPSATETYHEGYNPRAVRRGHGSWLRFLDALELLSPEESRVLAEGEGFLDQLETTQMTRSYKMLTLRAMLQRDALPGSLGIDELVEAFGREARRSAVLRGDVGEPLDDQQRLRRHLEVNPIAAWSGGRGTGAHAYFQYEDGVFGTTFAVADGSREEFQSLVQEIADWRLAEYLDRSLRPREGFECKVSHSGGRPILFLPDRGTTPGIPSGWTPVEADGELYKANFVKVAVNVMQRPDDEGNVIGQILKGWFGDEAGQPGTHHRVFIEPTETGYRMEPTGVMGNGERAVLWETYRREEIPGLWGFEFSRSRWQQGFISLPDHIFLLVTLEKGDLQKEHRYRDRFLSPTSFQWQSQNRTSQKSGHGQQIRNHAEQGLAVHLFVRKRKRAHSKAAPFHYCGEVDFERWEGEKPITVWWKLRNELPEVLFKSFSDEK